MTDFHPRPDLRSPVSTPALSADLDCTLSAYDYELPSDRIAQNPVVPRDRSRLLAVTSPTTHAHHIFRDLPTLLKPGDLLVLNNTRVLPARLYGRKVGGSAIEILLLEEQAPDRWLALVKPGRRLKPGARVVFEASTRSSLEAFIPEPQSPDLSTESIVPDPLEGSSLPPVSALSLSATIVATDAETGGRIIQFDLPQGQSLLSIVEALGEVPLPPYITASQADPEQYQTVYGDRPGAVAAPTAGLHFTPDLLTELQTLGIEHRFITLHVGVGTFRPVEAPDITTHKMHGEWIEVPAATVDQIHQTKAQGGRIIAVGTTVTRALEGAAQTGTLQPYCGKTDLFIYPGYPWQVIDGLITNFHLPKSSLMMLVSALIGRERLLALYQEAIAHQYRFYSFGDAMLILPEARNFRS